MQKKLVEFMESVTGIAEAYQRDEEKLQKKFQNESQKIISSIKAERENVIKKQKDTESELKRIRMSISILKQRYNKKMQESNEEETGKLEQQILELTEQERVLTLRKDAFSEITGCNNENTRESFNRLYTLYGQTKKEEEKIRQYYTEVLEELQKLKEVIIKETKSVEFTNNRYDSSISNLSIANYMERDIICAFETIHGEIKLSDDERKRYYMSDEHIPKLRIINSKMAQK